MSEAPAPGVVPEPPSARAELAGVPGRPVLGLLLGVVLLWVVFYHGRLHLGPRWDLFSWFGINFLALFVAPALLIRLVWRESLRDYGLTLGLPREWGKYLALYAAVMLPAVVVASRLPEMQRYYPRYPFAGESVGWFLAAAGGWLVYFFAWEFFFRGFLLNLWGRRYGVIAIAMQTVPFAMMHFSKPQVEALSSVAAGVALGWMAWRGRSFLGCWLLHWFVAVLLDLLVLVWR